MYISYGSYDFAPGEANLTNFHVGKRRSARGFNVANIVTANVSGTFALQAGEDQYDLSTRIQAFIDVMLVDGQDFGLKHDDGTYTPHYMQSSNSLSLTGNQIKNFYFDQSHNGEYSTGRDFSFTVENEFLAAASMILQYEETIEHKGTTGPSVVWREHPTYGPYFNVSTWSSIQQIKQYGKALTLGTWLIPPNRILPPPFELEAIRTIRRRSPRRYPQGYEGYLLEWEYTYNVPAIFPAFPSTR